MLLHISVHASCQTEREREFHLEGAIVVTMQKTTQPYLQKMRRSLLNASIEPSSSNVSKLFFIIQETSLLLYSIVEVKTLNPLLTTFFMKQPKISPKGLALKFTQMF